MKNIQCPVGKRIRSNSSLRWRTKKRARGRRHEKKKGGEGVGRAEEGRGRGDFEASAGLGKLTQIGWIVNAPSCAAASALRKISPPFHPRPECATPSLPRWTMRFRNMNRRGGWPKPVFTTQCFEGTWEGRRRRGKVSGVFSLILSSFFSVFRFFFSFFFFRVLVVNSCGWDFCSFCFLSFFFSIVKKGILGETFSVCCYRWSCVVVVFDLSDDSFFFWRRNFNWMMKEGILVINNMDSFLFFFYLELWKYI